MISLYNAKTEKEQIDVLSSLFELLEEFDTNPTNQLVMAVDFNLFFDSKLEAQSGNRTLKINLSRNSLNLKSLMIYVIYGG